MLKAFLFATFGKVELHFVQLSFEGLEILKKKIQKVLPTISKEHTNVITLGALHWTQEDNGELRRGRLTKYCCMAIRHNVGRQ